MALAPCGGRGQQRAKGCDLVPGPGRQHAAREHGYDQECHGQAQARRDPPATAHNHLQRRARMKARRRGDAPRGGGRSRLTGSKTHDPPPARQQERRALRACRLAWTLQRAGALCGNCGAEDRGRGEARWIALSLKSMTDADDADVGATVGLWSEACKKAFGRRP